MDKSTLLGHAI